MIIVVFCVYLQADNTVNVVDVDNSSIVLSHRLNPLNTPPLEKGTPIYLTLQEILIVGNCHEQVSRHPTTTERTAYYSCIEEPMHRWIHK